MDMLDAMMVLTSDLPAECRREAQEQLTAPGTPLSDKWREAIAAIEIPSMTTNEPAKPVYEHFFLLRERNEKWSVRLYPGGRKRWAIWAVPFTGWCYECPENELPPGVLAAAQPFFAQPAALGFDITDAATDAAYQATLEESVLEVAAQHAQHRCTVIK